MIGAFLAFTVLTAQVPLSDPVALVAQLGSGRYAQRESAASALERLGRQALPALQSARDVKDPEIRSRASALITRIEGGLLTKPTMVTLDYQDQPLAEIVKSIGDQSGVKMAIFPEQIASLQQKRLTLQESAPIPFWKAVDRLCDAAQLQYNFGMHGIPNSREPVFALVAGASRPPGPMCDSGPFRVNLVGLHYQRDVSFIPSGQAGFANRVALGQNPPLVPRPGHMVNEQFYAQIQVAAEPRLSISQSGQLKLTEAIDNRGQSLLIPTSGGPLVQRYAGYFGVTAGSSLHLQAPLRRPDQPGRSIHRLRGTLPVIVATRKGDPLVVPLSGSAGKTFHNDEVSLGVLDVRLNPNTSQTSIELSVRANHESGSDADLLATGIATIGIRRHDANQQQIEVLDAQGRQINWYPSNISEGSRMTLTLTPHEQGPPVEIRYYAMVKAATDVSFEFNDVPLP